MEPGCTPPALPIYVGSGFFPTDVTNVLHPPISPGLLIDIAQERLHLFCNKIFRWLQVIYELLVNLFGWPRGW
jgi:hypothetical protein